MSLLHVSRRSLTGVKLSQLRKQGIIPLGLVEKTHTTLPLQMPKAEFRRAMAHGGHTHIDVLIEGETDPRKAIVKQIEVDPINHEIIHVALQEFLIDDLVKLDVPIVGVGQTEDNLAAGTTLTQALNHLKVKGRADVVPELIEVDISGVQAGESITAAQIPLPEGVELLTPADAVVFNSSINRTADLPVEAEVAPVEEAAPAE